MPSIIPPFSLRIPKELLDKVRRIAARNKRSTNKELEYVIEQYVAHCENKHSDIKLDN